MCLLYGTLSFVSNSYYAWNPGRQCWRSEHKNRAGCRILCIARVCAYMLVCVCVCAYVCTCVRLCVCVHVCLSLATKASSPQQHMGCLVCRVVMSDLPLKGAHDHPNLERRVCVCVCAWVFVCVCSVCVLIHNLLSVWKSYLDEHKG